MSFWIYPNKKQSQRVSRCFIQHGLLVLMALITLMTLSACQIEISNRPPESVDAVTPTPTETDIAEVPTVVASPPTTPTLVPTDTPSPTPTPLPAPTETPTPTAIVWIPAQSPPDELTIPAISLDTPISQTTWVTDTHAGQTTTIWQVPDFVAGWHINSALPGQNSNVVLSGHHNIKGEVFRYLVDLKAGDEIILHADGRDYYYAVTDRFILPEKDASPEQRLQNGKWILPTTDERLTLVTCYPYTNNTHRVIVVAKPTNPQLAAHTP